MIFIDHLEMTLNSKDSTDNFYKKRRKRCSKIDIEWSMSTNKNGMNNSLTRQMIIRILPPRIRTR
jgi:hypothetical protein